MLLLLYEAQQREAATGAGRSERDPGAAAGAQRGELDEGEVARLRGRRQEIGDMLREIEHVAADHRELPQDKLQEMQRRARSNQGAGGSDAGGRAYFDNRVRKIRAS